MTQQEYNDICAQTDCILSELGPDFNDDNPRIERLINLSNKADEYYKEQHTEGDTDIEISLEVQILVRIFRFLQLLRATGKVGSWFKPISYILNFRTSQRLGSPMAKFSSE